MTRREITKLAEAKWGKRAVVKENRSAPTPAEREEARKLLTKLRENKTPENRRERDALLSVVLSHRYWIGEIHMLPGLGPCIGVRGHGDTWEEAWERANH